MKKSLTLALVLAALAIFAGPGGAQESGKPKSPTKPPTTVNNSKSNNYRAAAPPGVITGTVTQLNLNDKTFTVEVNFSAAKLEALPKVGETISTTYTGTPGGVLEATTVKSGKSNSDERIAANIATGKVMRVDERGKTFAVEVAFSAAKLEALPKVGEIISTTYTGTSGGQLEATSVKSTKSNGSERITPKS